MTRSFFLYKNVPGVQTSAGDKSWSVTVDAIFIIAGAIKPVVMVDLNLSLKIAFYDLHKLYPAEFFRVLRKINAFSCQFMHDFD